MSRSHDEQPATTLVDDAPPISNVALPGDGAGDGSPERWRRIEMWEYFVLGAAVLAVALIAFPYLPPGICFGDNGDLQLASITLGIMHPPGYAGFSTLGYLLTRVPVIDKPFLITLGCLGSGLAVLWFCALMQMRLGLHAVAAALTMLLFAAHKRFWWNVITPEVYMPALAFLALAAYLLMRHARTGRLGSLVGSAVCLGFCIGNRPTAVLTVPFFVVAHVAASRRSGEPIGRCIRGLAIATGCALVPVVYSFAYVLIRDQPTTAYNYLNQHNRAHHVLPQTSDGLTARVRRAVWLLTAEQFRPEFGTTWNGLRQKLRWLRNDLLYGQPMRLSLAMLLVLGGLVTCFRRDAVAGWLLAGIGLHSVAFVLIYRVYGQAADSLPFVFAAAVLLGVALSVAIPRTVSRKAAIVVAAIGVVVVVSVWRAADVPKRWKVSSDSNAVPFLAELDPATLPGDALILSGWAHAVPLWYSQYALVKRPDIDVLAGDPGQVEASGRDVADRPVFVVHRTSDSEGLRVEPYRNVWRVVRADGADDDK